MIFIKPVLILSIIGGVMSGLLIARADCATNGATTDGGSIVVCDADAPNPDTLTETTADSDQVTVEEGAAVTGGINTVSGDDTIVIEEGATVTGPENGITVSNGLNIIADPNPDLVNVTISVDGSVSGNTSGIGATFLEGTVTISVGQNGAVTSNDIGIRLIPFSMPDDSLNGSIVVEGSVHGGSFGITAGTNITVTETGRVQGGLVGIVAPGEQTIIVEGEVSGSERGINAFTGADTVIISGTLTGNAEMAFIGSIEGNDTVILRDGAVVNGLINGGLLSGEDPATAIDTLRFEFTNVTQAEYDALQALLNSLDGVVVIGGNTYAWRDMEQVINAMTILIVPPTSPTPNAPSAPTTNSGPTVVLVVELAPPPAPAPSDPTVASGTVIGMVNDTPVIVDTLESVLTLNIGEAATSIDPATLEAALATSSIANRDPNTLSEAERAIYTLDGEAFGLPGARIVVYLLPDGRFQVNIYRSGQLVSDGLRFNRASLRWTLEP